MLKKMLSVTALALGLMIPAFAQESTKPQPIRYLNTVESIEAVVEGDSLSLVIRGVLSDGCQADTEIFTERVNNVWFIDLFRTLPADTACTKAILPFEVTVPADELNTLDAEAFLPSHVVVNDKIYRVERAMVEPVEGSTAPIIAPMFTELARGGFDIELLNHIINEDGSISIQATSFSHTDCLAVIARPLPAWKEAETLEVEIYTGIGLADICLAQLTAKTVTVNTSFTADTADDFVVNGIQFDFDPTISSNVQEFAVQPMIVEEVEVLTLESFPVQYNIQVSGTTDGCPQPPQAVVRQIVDNYVYVLVVRTVPPMQPCTMIAKPYTASVTLPSTALPSGTINLWVNNVEQMTFENQ